MANRRRVAFPFVGLTIGGSHMSSIALIKLLQNDERYEPFVILHESGPLQDLLVEEDVPFEKCPTPRIGAAGGPLLILQLLLLSLPLAVWLRWHRIDIVHLNDNKMVNCWALAARIANKKLLIHQRTRWISSRINNGLSKLADRFITISDFVKNSMPDQLSDKAITILNPLQPVREEGSLFPAKNVSEDDGTPKVVFVGTLQTQKRPDIFIRAAAMAFAEDPGLRFVLYGRDHDAAKQAKNLVKKLEMDEFMEFAGYRKDVIQQLSSATVLVAPAINEGHGRALLEAMILGIPVVASNSGGHRELDVERHGGLLVNPDDPGAFAAAILERTRPGNPFSAQARKTAPLVAEKYKPTIHVEAVKRIYNDLSGTGT